MKTPKNLHDEVVVLTTHKKTKFPWNLSNDCEVTILNSVVDTLNVLLGLRVGERLNVILVPCLLVQFTVVFLHQSFRFDTPCVLFLWDKNLFI